MRRSTVLSLPLLLGLPDYGYQQPSCAFCLGNTDQNDQILSNCILDIEIVVFICLSLWYVV